jgi:hypothetical protein
LHENTLDNNSTHTTQNQLHITTTSPRHPHKFNNKEEIFTEQALSPTETPTRTKQPTNSDTKRFELDKTNQNFNKTHQSKGKEENDLHQ